MRFFNDKISLRQLQILLVLDLFGTGVITVPRVAAGFSGENGWLATAAAVAVMLVYAYVAASVSRIFPDKGFVEYSCRLLGRPLGLAAGFLLVAKIIIGISLEMRIFIEVVRETMLLRTPYTVIFTCIIGAAAYAAGKGFETRARLAELLAPLVFIPFTLVLLLAAIDADYTNLLPIMRTKSPADVIAGGIFIGTGYKGIEYLLLVHPFLENPQGLRRAALSAVGAIGGLITLATAITIATFGASGLTHQRWPFLEIMDTINFPGAFLERQDAIIMSIWIISVFAILSSGLFFSAIILKDAIRKGRHFHYVMAVIPLVYAVSILPENIVGLGEGNGLIDSILMCLGLFYMLALPLLLITLAHFNKRRLGR